MSWVLIIIVTAMTTILQAGRNQTVDILLSMILLLGGVVAGVAVGLFVSGQMLSFLEVSEAGERVEPPFVVHTRWLVVAGAAAVVLAACVAALVKVAATLRRSTDAEALRSE